MYIQGWSPRTSFQTLLTKIDNYKGWNLLSNRDIGYIDESNASNGTRVCFEVVKLRNKPAIFKKMKEAISKSLFSSLTYNVIVVTPTGEVKDNVDIDGMLLYTYGFYQTTLKLFYEKSIDEIKSKIKELEIVKKIQPYVSDAVKEKTFEKIVKFLSDKTKVPVSDVKTIVNNYRIKKLLTVSTDIEGLKKELEGFEKCLSDIEKVTIKNYRELKEKNV